MPSTWELVSLIPSTGKYPFIEAGHETLSIVIKWGSFQLLVKGCALSTC